ncbi:hypothetical protein GQ53DRAFT_390790 [Thozetella sp. PMI_491]|nr:hypothetical protein GQ53DRAFT_390790 [Thozetella sp. PMI_491]
MASTGSDGVTNEVRATHPNYPYAWLRSQFVDGKQSSHPHLATSNSAGRPPVMPIHANAARPCNTNLVLDGGHGGPGSATYYCKTVSRTACMTWQENCP